MHYFIGELSVVQKKIYERHSSHFSFDNTKIFASLISNFWKLFSQFSVDIIDILNQFSNFVQVILCSLVLTILGSCQHFNMQTVEAVKNKY